MHNRWKRKLYVCTMQIVFAKALGARPLKKMLHIIVVCLYMPNPPISKKKIMRQRT